MIEALGADLPRSEEKVWARHILTGDENSANIVYEMLMSGDMSFPELVPMFSIDPGSAPKGGDLGWFGRGEMIAEFEEAAFALTEVGEISLPVRSVHGFHIIQLLGRADIPVSPERYRQIQALNFQDWLGSQRESLTLSGALTIDTLLRDRVMPSEPSFNDPKVYEALFGIKPADAARTSAAESTRSAEVIQQLTREATPLPAEE